MNKAVLIADEEERGCHPCLLIEGASQSWEEVRSGGQKESVVSFTATQRGKLKTVAFSQDSEASLTTGSLLAFYCLLGKLKVPAKIWRNTNQA